MFYEKFFNSSSFLTGLNSLINSPEKTDRKESMEISNLLEYVFQLKKITPEILDSLSIEELNKAIDVVENFKLDDEKNYNQLNEMVEVENAKNNLKALKTMQTTDSSDFF